MVVLQRCRAAQVDEKRYPGMRHEILNEPDHAVVESDIISWIEGCLSRSKSRVGGTPEEGE